LKEKGERNITRRKKETPAERKERTMKPEFKFRVPAFGPFIISRLTPLHTVVLEKLTVPQLVMGNMRNAHTFL
jgi:hypothetical protein